jgi:hypothetical protein
MLLFVLCFCNCRRVIEVDSPVTSTNGANVYQSDATATAVLTGIYTNMSAQNNLLPGAYLSTMFLYPALTADELTLYNPNDGNLVPFYKNDLTSSFSVYWNNIYSIIFVANSAIEGLNGSSGLTPAIKQQLLGEAKFIRAFCYFYLVNLFGDVPLTLTADYKTNAVLSRTPITDVYQQIIQDLEDSQNLLSDKYLKSDALSAYSSGTEQRVRPTKWAATALLARVYLYIENYAKAEAAATSVINNSLFKLSTLAGAFKMNSFETIWALQPVGIATKSNTGEGAIFILPSTGPNNSLNDVYLSRNLINSFETNDLRKANWVNSVVAGGITYYYPYKYKVGLVNTPTSEYSIVLRLAEQYLIRAEARAYGAGIGLPGAITDIDTIRTRAGLPKYSGVVNKDSVLKTILHERQVELFTEWGHRWFDLKRTKTINAVMDTTTRQKGGIWSSYKSLYPIAQSELSLDPNLVQNAGY